MTDEESKAKPAMPPNRVEHYGFLSITEREAPGSGAPPEPAYPGAGAPPEPPNPSTGPALEPPTPPPDCPRCASERAQSRSLAETLNEYVDALKAVRAYADECMSRAGAQVDVATVAVSLAPILSGRAPDPGLPLSARVRLLEDAISRDEHPAVVRHMVAELVGMLRERGLA